jgi:hypothetical protein
MKKVLLFVLIMIFSLSTSTVIASKPDPRTAPPENSVVSLKTENKLSEEELNRITKRVEEISLMDKSNLTAKDKRELRQELRGYRQRGYGQRGYGHDGYRHGGGVYYFGGGSLLLIIILIILLAG